MTQKELRKQARVVLAQLMTAKGKSGEIPAAGAIALQVLHAPNLKGE